MIGRPSVASVEYRMEKCSSWRTTPPEMLDGSALEMLQRDLRCFCDEHDAIPVADTFRADGEEYRERRWYRRWIGIGAFAHPYVTSEDHWWTEWRATLWAFRDVRPEHRKSLTDRPFRADIVRIQMPAWSVG